MKAKQVKKDKDVTRGIDASTTFRYFNKGEKVRLRSIDSEGNFEVGIVEEVKKDYAEKVTHYIVSLMTDPTRRIHISVWDVKSMDTPEKPLR